MMDDPPEGLRATFCREDLPVDHMRAAYDYWLAARGAAVVPPVSALDPMLLPRGSLPYLSVLEVEQAPFRLRSRLTGTALVDHLGINQTGHYLDEIPGIARQLARMEWCVHAQQPYLAEDKLTFAPKDYKRYHVLILPFGDPGRGVERLVGVFGFHGDGNGDAPSWTR